MQETLTVKENKTMSTSFKFNFIYKWHLFKFGDGSDFHCEDSCSVATSHPQTNVSSTVVINSWCAALQLLQKSFYITMKNHGKNYVDTWHIKKFLVKILKHNTLDTTVFLHFSCVNCESESSTTLTVNFLISKMDNVIVLQSWTIFVSLIYSWLDYTSLLNVIVSIL
jgi:hypothetical protein